MEHGYGYCGDTYEGVRCTSEATHMVREGSDDVRRFRCLTHAEIMVLIGTESITVMRLPAVATVDQR